jgi:Zn-dependent M16 (insulinase) family peptidase
VNDFFTYAFVGRNDIAKIPISLEQSLILLPYVKNLINNQYNAYNITGCKTGMIFIKILFEIVVTTKQNLNSNLKGLDVFEKLDADFEEKVNKCDEIMDDIISELDDNFQYGNTFAVLTDSSDYPNTNI